MPLDPKMKKMLAVVENYGKVEGDYAQLEPIVLKDLQQNKGMFKDKTFEQVKADPALYDEVVGAYLERIEDFGIPNVPTTKAMWWLMPGRYRQTKGDITKVPKPFRNVMSNRAVNLNVYLKELKRQGSE